MKSEHVLIGQDERFAVPGCFRVVRCLGCGLMCQDPSPLVESEGFHEVPYNFGPFSRWYRSYALLMNASRARFLCSLKQPGRLLDIGCGDGSFLAQAQKRGWQVSGTEVSARACLMAQERLGLLIHLGDLPELGFASDHFDAVTLWHVLEHVARPNELLSEVKRILAPGGVLVVEVPNIVNPVFGLFREHYFHLDLPRHAYFYNRATLAAMLEKHGFAVGKIGASWHYPESIAKSAARRLGPGGGLARRVARMALSLLLALPTLGYLAATALGAPPEVIRVAAAKPRG